MQQALGMIETKGLLAAIESADAMLKAAEVSLLERTFVGGGLVTISVTGDVAAVKASVEAGVASVNRIDAALLVSDHVIPRPHMELDDVVIAGTPLKDRDPAEETPTETEPDTEPEGDPEVSAEPEIEETEAMEERIPEGAKAANDAATEEPEAVEGMKSETAQADEAAEAVQASDRESEITIPTDDVHKDDIDRLISEHGLQKVMELISHCRVTKLRNLAREYEDFGITGREISKADKKTLLSEFEKYYNN